MRFGIDARELTGQPTGVGRLLAGLLDAWPADDDLVLYAREPLPWAFLSGNRRSRIVAGPRRLPGALWEQTMLPRQLRRDGVTALFSPAYGMPARAPCGVVVGMHDCAAEATPEEFGWRERWRRRWTARSASRRAAFLLVGSRFSAAEIRRWYGTPRSRIVTAAYGVAPAFAQVDEAKIAAARRKYELPEQSILFVGAPLGRRRLPQLIEIVEELARTRPGLRLCVVGPGAQRSTASSSTLSDTSAVRWLGFVPEVDLPGLYAAATVVAYPSSYEGFGFPVLEALACGTPVVASDNSSLAEIFAERTCLVGDDASDWAGALGTLLDDPRERQRYVDAAQPWARGRDWAPAARLVRRLLIDITTRGNGAVHR